jgi:hypothetical protein
MLRTAVITTISLLAPLSAAPGQATELETMENVDYCHAPVDVTTASVCTLVPGKASQLKILLFGDSHAAHHYPALIKVAERHGTQGLQLTKTGCPVPEIDTTTGAGQAYPQCPTWRESALTKIGGIQPDIVLSTSAHSYSTLALDSPGGSPMSESAFISLWQQGFDRSTERLLSGGTKVLHLHETPYFPADPNVCLEKAAKATECDVPKSKTFESYSPTLRRHESGWTTRSDDFRTLDLTDDICSVDTCKPANADGSARYRDSNHLAAGFSASLWKRFSSQIAKVVSLPPAHIVGLKAQVKKGRAKLNWKGSHPGSANQIKYRVTIKPTSKAKKLGAKTIKGTTKKLKFKSEKLVKGSKYTIKVTAQGSSGSSPAIKAKLRN